MKTGGNPAVGLRIVSRITFLDSVDSSTVSVDDKTACHVAYMIVGAGKLTNEIY